MNITELTCYLDNNYLSTWVYIQQFVYFFQEKL